MSRLARILRRFHSLPEAPQKPLSDAERLWEEWQRQEAIRRARAEHEATRYFGPTRTREEEIAYQREEAIRISQQRAGYR